MAKRKKILTSIAVLTVITLMTIGAVCWDAFYGMLHSQSMQRAEYEHGLILPASTANIQCRGDAYRLILDRGASTAFEMDRSELSRFKQQLQLQAGLDTCVPGNRQYQGLTFGWLKGIAPLEVLSCVSPTGDWLHVEIWPIDERLCGVRLYTDWN